ncbi:MAG: SUMF1/EgtB/PvdO family nonheme iron enzyme [Capsulimonadaceae bacterium]
MPSSYRIHHSSNRRRLTFLIPALLLAMVPTIPSTAQAPNKDLQEVPAASGSVVTLSPLGNAKFPETRVALVIGKEKYEGNALENPDNDAHDMARTLRTLGFTVLLGTDLDVVQMKDAIEQFDVKLQGAGVGLFYYSGHGAQVEGTNYLIPIGCHVQREFEMPDETVSADRVVEAMVDAGSNLNVLILDACRDNPFPSTLTRSLKGFDRGLARMTAPTNTLLAYATGPGSTASDYPEGHNGLYTGELLKQIMVPGQPLEDVFRETRKAVDRASNRQQIPWEDSSLETRFCFLPAGQSPAAVPAVVTPSVIPIDTVAHLKLSGLPDGAAVTVDRVAQSGSIIDLDLGTDKTRTVELAIMKPGFKPYVAQVTLDRGVESDLPISLIPLPSPPTPASDKVNPTDGADMVYIPAGEFTMGSDDDHSNDCEKPAHKVYLDGYYIYKNLVTVAQYKKFCAATSRAMPTEPSWGWDKDDYPMVNVTWDGATAYAQWAGTSLPTEAQWEKAARGTDGRAYPWGNDWDAARCANSVGSSLSSPTSVGSFSIGASPYGVLDMAGNVWEWCSDWFGVDYYSSSPDKNPTGPSSGTWRVLRGGSWCGNDPVGFRASYRDRILPTCTSGLNGFRCASSEP